MNDGKGIRLELDSLELPITTLTELGDLAGELVSTASRLAMRLPMLGTAPPAVHLAMRLREAAGSSGLEGALKSAEREVREYGKMLEQAKAKYQEQDARSGDDLKVKDVPTDAAGAPRGDAAGSAGRSS
ncbi:hypothetical protein [Saccharomonospora cyanea]|uniref:Excreted virulence factor EspC, type VII ESX diderm n=1 Tax=Saccharomonospora cyanea NA-134 TaxID=882082 RepID=H5XHG3_9PSEU|nr:hypothetical protein [Saccharomonospora cyanea]EHR61643.1 hypothetical protein SaccyDRAFT_2797 [Saccharomonospora cyanea NA-134]